MYPCCLCPDDPTNCICWAQNKSSKHQLISAMVPALWQLLFNTAEYEYEICCLTPYIWEALTCPVVGITDGCEPSNKHARNQTQVLCRSIKGSRLLSNHLRPQNVLIFKVNHKVMGFIMAFSYIHIIILCSYPSLSSHCAPPPSSLSSSWSPSSPKEDSFYPHFTNEEWRVSVYVTYSSSHR